MPAWIQSLQIRLQQVKVTLGIVHILEQLAEFGSASEFEMPDMSILHVDGDSQC